MFLENFLRLQRGTSSLRFFLDAAVCTRVHGGGGSGAGICDMCDTVDG